MKNITVKNIFRIISIALVIVFFFSYFIYQIVSNTNAKIKTETAYKDVVYETIDTKCFVLRDEQFIKNDTKGTTVSFATNGERVARGDTVSIVFDSSEDAATYIKAQELRKSVKHFEELSGQANFQSLNINSLNKKINNELFDYMDAIDKREYKKASDLSETFRDSVTGKQIATGSVLDFSEKLNELRGSLDELSKQNASYTEIKTENAGYFISGSDGYEKTLSFSDIDKLTADDVSEALKAKPQDTSSDIIGRTVSSFTWYIACVIDTDETVKLSYDKDLYINFPVAGIEKLPVSLYKIGERTEDETLVIFSCDEMNENLSDFRIEDIQIITDEYSGFRISNSAIRTLDGEQGVYIVRGNLMGFRKIHVVYTSDKFSIVDNPDGSSGYIKLYDKVVTEGVDLYDNKLI